jgi:crossover junction endodeoxyribonuclease RusA
MAQIDSGSDSRVSSLAGTGLVTANTRQALRGGLFDSSEDCQRQELRQRDLTFLLPWPPSVNALWRSINGRAILSRKGREYRLAGLSSLSTQPVRRWSAEVRLSVTAVLNPPTRRSFDIDNFWKAPGDLLTHAGIYIDDSQIDRLCLQRGPVVKGGRVAVTITPLDATLFEGQA